MMTAPMTLYDFNDIVENMVNSLSTTEMIEDSLSRMEPSRVRDILAWLNEHGISSDVDFLLNYDRLEKEIKEEWQQSSN